jgi:MFS family permease
VQSFVKRLPIIIGPLLGGLFIDKWGVVAGVRAGLGISCLLGLVALIVQWQIQDNPQSRNVSRQGFFVIVQQMSPALRRLLLSDILIRFCERLPYAWVVIYAMDYVGVSGIQVGLLTGVEMLTAMICTIPPAYFADKYKREPFIIATFVFFTLFPATLLFAKTFLFLIIAFVVRGLKEFGEPARKAHIISSCPAEARGRLIGSYYMIRDLIVAIGAVVGATLWRFGPRMNFSVAVVLGATGTFFYLITASRKSMRG